MLTSIATFKPLLASAVPRDVASGLILGAADTEVFVTELRNLPEGWIAVLGLGVVLALIYSVVWMYRHEGRTGASLRRRTMLAVIRCLVLVLLAVIVLEPVRVRILRRWIDSYTIVLVDSSSSMDLQDAYRNAENAARVRSALRAQGSNGDTAQPPSDLLSNPPIRRSAIVDELLRRDRRKFLHDLARNNRIKLYRFSHEPQLISTIRAAREEPAVQVETPAAGETPRGIKPAARAEKSPQHDAQTLPNVNDVSTSFPAMGRSTNIERALHRSVESLGDAPIAGVVVLSDGGFNEGAPAEDTARYARDRKLPVYAVGIGDPSPPRNVRVTEILAPKNAFKQDPFTISAQLASDGLEGRSIRVELHESRRDAGTSAAVAGERLIEAQNMIVGSGGAINPVMFQHRQPAVGRFVYTVKVPIVEEESVADDNSKQTTVNVIDARTRVLIVSGQPSWDYRFVSRLLERDESIEVSCWLQSADLTAVRDGNAVIDHLPRLAEELFEYDVIVLMDPDAAALNEPWCQLVDTLVTEHGGGLLFAAARTHTPASLREPSLEPLRDLLPVTFDPDADLILNRIGHYQRASSPIEIPETAYGHPILQLAADPVSTKLGWQGIGDVHWHYPVLREKPVATTLMRHGGPGMRNASGGHVLAATHFVGAGRTGFIAFDGTWRWRRHGEELFNRFWVQFIRYLAEGKLLGGTKRGMLLTEADQFSLSQAVTVTARLFDERYEPLQRDEVPAQYTVEGERTDFTLSARRDRPGWFEGRFVPSQAGAYRITVKVPGVGTTPRAGGSARAQARGSFLGYEIAREIHVTRPNLEILRPQMDRAALTTLAEQSHGGRYFEVDQMLDVPGVIPDLHEEISIRSRPTALWDNWKILTLLIALLSVEWFVRKWSRLL